MTKQKKLKPGTQILYVPMHAEGDETHPDVEAGFVTSLRITASKQGDQAFCRYWSKYHPGKLRTTLNSELTPIACLIVKDTVVQELVDLWFLEQR